MGRGGRGGSAAEVGGGGRCLKAPGPVVTLRPALGPLFLSDPPALCSAVAAGEFLPPSAPLYKRCPKQRRAVLLWVLLMACA